MIDTLDRLSEQYAAALETHLVEAGDAELHLAYELGRKAVAEGVDVVQMVSIHNRALTALLDGFIFSDSPGSVAERAAAFLAGCLAPYEMLLSASREMSIAPDFKARQFRVFERRSPELLSAEQTLEAERRRYQELLNFTPDSYLLTDPEGIIQEANKSAAALLQRSQELLIGQSLPRLVLAEERESVYAEMAWLRRKGLEKTTIRHTTFPLASGAAIPVDVTIGLAHDSDGNVIGLHWLLRDITRRIQIDEEREQFRTHEQEIAKKYDQLLLEKQKAEQGIKAREEFVARLSHELRTPLMTVLGWARVLGRQPQIVEDQVLYEGVRSLEHNSQYISRLIEDCLDIARLSEGKIHLQRKLVDLNQVANAAFQATRDLASAKNLKFITEFSPNLYVWGDRTRLEEVVLNLLTNAIKYTEQGGELCLSLRKTDHEVEIQVQDTGMGIDPNFLEQIFQPFRQGTANPPSSQSGLGIGLAIVREIIQMHSGRIWAESPGLGEGSIFRFRLPLAKVQGEQNRADATEQLVSTDMPPIRVLFIEDSKDVLRLMKMELEGLGFSVLVAADGETGLEMAKRELPDVVVSDIRMPGFDGYELIKRLRQEPALASIPAIALTGLGMRKDIEEAFEAGYSAHLCKPVETDELAALIRKLVSTNSQQQSA